MKKNLKHITGTLILSLPQSLNNVDQIRHSAMNFYKTNKVDEDTIVQIELSVYEVLMNILDHSSEKYRNQEIELKSKIIDDRVETIIKNIGDFFDLTNTVLPKIEDFCKEGNRRGLGLYIIRTLMDNVSYTHNNNTNIVTLTKFRSTNR
jgi:serine/threonine-protein kinase RsbW